MIEYEGKWGKAKVMIDNIDSETISQIYEFLNNEVFVNPISIMPYCHAGAGAVIGFTMELTDKIIPNIVGVDIGCGILSNNVGKELPNWRMVK
ncbi:MAG: RtcB family protein [Candidatus Thorarchaeota archaeon]|jgi:RNA-splicing ligase RtcB